jgi:hydrogenase/urease accessory protein HupE
VGSTSKTRASRPGLLATVLLVSCVLRGTADAHDPGLSGLEVAVGPAHVDVTLSIASADAEMLRAPHDAVHVWSDGVALTRPLLHTTRDSTGVRIVLRFDTSYPKRLTVTSEVPAQLSRGHRQLVSIRTMAGGVLAERLIDAAANTVAVELTQAEPGGAAAARFFSLGIHHIVSGYDHLLFLAAMLLVATTFRAAAAIITAFSAAHAAALVLASIGLITMPAAVVEPLIAASVIWVGLENVWRREVAGRWRPAFAFGLVHGLAFAGALSELGAAETTGSLVARLAYFNLGIEAGQLAFAALVLPLLWYVHRWPQAAARVQVAGSICVVVAGGYWLLLRM